MSKYVLMHGTFVELTDEELMHWKYIKKVKKNGRWVYYYDEASAKKELNKAKTEQHSAWIRALEAAAPYNQDKDAFNKVSKEYETNVTKWTNDHDYYQAKANLALSSYKYHEADKKYKAKVKKYETLKVKQLAHKTISKGIIAVANFFSKLFSKKK